MDCINYRCVCNSYSNHWIKKIQTGVAKNLIEKLKLNAKNNRSNRRLKIQWNKEKKHQNEIPKSSNYSYSKYTWNKYPIWKQRLSNWIKVQDPTIWWL